MDAYIAIEKHEPIWRFIGISAIIHFLLLAVVAERPTPPSTKPMSPRLEVAILPEPAVGPAPSRDAAPRSEHLENAGIGQPRRAGPPAYHAVDERGTTTDQGAVASPQQESPSAMRLIESGLDYARNIPPKDPASEVFAEPKRVPPMWLLDKSAEPDPPGLFTENEQIDLEIVDYGSIDGFAKVKVAYPGRMPYCLEFDLVKTAEELDERMVLATRGPRCK